MEIEQTILYIFILIFSVVLHEVAHGYAADYLGDRTARFAGRLTVNPIPHLDMFGSIILPGLLVISGAPFLVGWAKPVPFNLHNISNKKWGPALIALAGPSANLILALVFSLLIKFQGFLSLTSGLVEVFSTVVIVNIVLMLFNLIPIPPLDGHHVLFSFLDKPENIGIKRFMIKNQFVLVLLALFVIWPLITPLVFRITSWLI